MVGILVDDIVIATVPAPARTVGLVPSRHFKEKIRPVRSVRPLASRIARVVLAGEAESDLGLRAVAYALALEIPWGCGGGSGGRWARSAGLPLRVKTIRILRQVVFILCPEVLDVVFCPSSALRSPSVSPTFLRASDVSWAQEPRAAKTVVLATSVYPQRKPVRSRCPRDSCY
jgi:hypothetical protein